MQIDNWTVVFLLVPAILLGALPTIMPNLNTHHIMGMGAGGVLGNSTSTTSTPRTLSLLVEQWKIDAAWSQYIAALMLVVAGFLTIKFLRFLWAPVHTLQTFEDAKQVGDTINRMKRLGNIPPPFPKYGWYRVAWSFDLPNVGSMHRVDCLGKNLLIVRGKNREITCLDAYCPHLGADLTLGVVKEKDGETCIECPFHGWMFRTTDGSCQSIPYTETTPNVSIHKYTVVEQNDMVLMWNDVNPPTYQPVYIPSVSNGQMKWHGCAEYEINCHIQEIPENGADVEHLGFLHTPLWGPLKYHWTADWNVHPTEPHNSLIKLTLDFTLFGKTIPLSWARVTIRQNGPAVVFLEIQMVFGNLVSVETVTPLKPMLQRVSHNIYCDWYVPRIVGKIALWSLTNQLARDIPIWHRKTYQEKPCLAKTEGSILKFRRWYRQFYGDEFNNNTTGNLRVENARDW